MLSHDVRTLNSAGQATYRWLALSAAVLVFAGCGARSGFDFAERADIDSAVPAGGANSGVPGQPPPSSGGCQTINLDIESLRPTVMLLVDQSQSMASPHPERSSPETRWSLVRQALFDSERGVVKQFEQSVRFGITFFTSHNGFSGGVCPLLSQVNAATDNYQALSALYDRLQPDDDTPTGAALETVVDALQAQPSRGPRSILLVTDGDADTCETPDPQTGQPQAVAAAQRAFAAGIAVSVLGISNDIGQHNLQQLANAGKGRAIDAVWGLDGNAAQPFEASDNVQGLTAQFADILREISLCTIALQRDTGVAEATAGRVLLDGRSLAYGASDGFVLENPRRLAITGKACEALREKGQRLTVRISCD